MTLDTARARWIALLVLCLGDLMIVVDVSIVNVALPSIADDLGFSETSLAWVVNAYLLTFGGFLLLGGRLGDLFGQRRLFLLGIALFTGASIVCGLANSQGMLVGARAVQGLGGAVVSAVALSLIIGLFSDPGERAKALGVFGFCMAGGGSIGVLLGGILTDLLSWHWIFLVNVPIGIAVAILTRRLLPATPGQGTGRIDVAGAVTITSALMLGVYAIVNGNGNGWLSAQTLGLLGAAAALFVAFVLIESRVAEPLVPFAVVKIRNVWASNVVGALWAAAMFAVFFLAALYLQKVLGYSALQVGLAFLPGNVIMGVFSLGLSAKLVMRFGIKPPLVVGLGLAAAALLLFARAPVDGNFWTDILPPMILIGFGAGMAFNPVLLAAMGGVKPEDSGLASGIVNTAFMMGGAVGLAVLVSLADRRTNNLGGSKDLDALTSGYHLAFVIGAIFAASAAVLGALLLRSPSLQQVPAGEPAVEHACNYQERPADGPPAGPLLLHHGRGADDFDLLPLGDALDPERRLHVVTPRAPLQLGGMPGYHWYVVPRVGFPDPETFFAAQRDLAALHDELWARTGLGPERTVLGGFSMGAVMSYATGLDGGRPRPAGILAFSGFVPAVEGWEPDLAGRAGLPVFIAHGLSDPVIEVGFGRQARDLLERGGLAVEYHEHAGGHAIHPDHVAAARDWLARLV